MKTLEEILARVELTEPAKAVREPTADRLVDRLASQQLFVDAIHVAAHALPKRDAVAWASWCARLAASVKPTPEVLSALEAAERWSNDPNEANRRAAQKAAEAAKLETPAGCAAMAAFFAEGNLAPDESKVVVPPADDLTGKCVSGAVLLAGVVSQPELAPERYGKFVAEALRLLRKR